MKKTYIAPTCKIAIVDNRDIIATSSISGKLGRGYSGDDVSYSRPTDSWEED